jgi:hypothetical protein
VLVICHSVVVLIFRRLLEHWDEAQYLEIDGRDEVLNCSVTAYHYDAASCGLKLDLYNHICYGENDLLFAPGGEFQPEGPDGEEGRGPA